MAKVLRTTGLPIAFTSHGFSSKTFWSASGRSRRAYRRRACGSLDATFSVATMSADAHSFSPIDRGAVFATTRWSVVLLAAEGGEGEAARHSLEALCRSYWYPVYAYIRRSGHGSE